MWFIRTSDKTTEWCDSYDGVLTWKTVIRNDTFENFTIVDARPKSKKSFMRQTTIEYPVSILKSNLQKTFRRNLVKPCLATAQHLLRQDTAEALRRLPIIFLEDGQWHPESFSLVVWLMAASSKGYRLSPTDETLVLSALTTALSATKRYALDIESNNSVQPKGYSIVLRNIYGGMKWDMDFLMRLARRSDQLEKLYAWLSTPEIKPFDITCMIPEAIDFHCCGGILTWCSEKTNLSTEEIKSAIWWHLSSTNVRELESCGVDSMETENVGREQTRENANILKPYVYEYATMKLTWMERSKKKRLIQTTLAF